MKRLRDNRDIKNGWAWQGEAERLAGCVSGLTASACDDGLPLPELEWVLHERGRAQRVLRKHHGIRYRNGRLVLTPVASLHREAGGDILRFLFWDRLVDDIRAASLAASDAAKSSGERAAIGRRGDGSTIYVEVLDTALFRDLLMVQVGIVFIEEDWAGMATALLAATDAERGVNFLTGRTASRLSLGENRRRLTHALRAEHQDIHEGLLLELRPLVAGAIAKGRAASPLGLSRLHTEAAREIAMMHDLRLPPTEENLLATRLKAAEARGDDPARVFEEQEVIREALRLLTEKQREVCLLWSEGYSRKEMADILGIGEESVKDHLAASRRKMAKQAAG